MASNRGRTCKIIFLFFVNKRISIPLACNPKLLATWRASRSSNKICRSSVSSAKAIVSRSPLSNSDGILGVIVETETTCSYLSAIANTINTPIVLAIAYSSLCSRIYLC
ncbi:hypothetical protein NIES4072_32100 [Nostoc commune NIES-4072]|uniref:Uncharacterized protein n=1 Tax=Nostoc commune NIES-4072 TaxID=2005467 RepID=A0A2R5FL89_NOSCO|nr:hypothetical protein [Nostoc commune]BBD69457.1 hypothetical protein NIES4070_58660 [Nostoc commune HK-02]GBG19542.1 hypothetical protein NIES4072_32100 [Nostoc commune NIES-4072]